MTLARSGVIDSVEITRSALPVCSDGNARGAGGRHVLELAGPSPWPAALAVSMSEPVGCILSSVMP